MKQIILSLMVFSLLMLASCGGGSGGGGGGSVGSDGNSSMDNGDMIGDNNGDGGSGGGSNNGTGNNGDGGGSNNGTGNNGNGGGSNNGTGNNGDGGGSNNGTGNNGNGGGSNNGTGNNGDGGGSNNGTGNNGDGGSDNNTGNSGNGGNSGGGNGGDSNNDADNDGVLDADEEAGCELKPDCDDDEVLDINEEPGCAKKPDCDDDRVDDINEAMGCAKKLNCDGDSQPDSIDIDDDGDGLIEIRNASELNAVRYVLNGTGFKATETAILDQTGCGNSSAIRDCSGYELVRDISLTDFIAKTNATAGWQPIASDVNVSNTECDGGSFTAMFDGNGLVVSGLFINRSDEDCIGLFGQVNGKILNLGVTVDKIIGRDEVGGLVGFGLGIEIVRSYVVAGEVRGGDSLGGLVGTSWNAEIVQSYAVTGIIRGNIGVGGLIGDGGSARIIQSYAVSSEVRGTILVGGLVGSAQNIFSREPETVQSYAVSGEVRGSTFVGGLVGISSIHTSYWDTETSGRTNSAADGGQTTSALRSPTGYTDIYDTWDDGAMVDGINVNTTIWCDEDASGMIEDDERRDDSHTNGDNRVWDFGTSTDYPALRCTGDSLADQRAWWYLNTTSHKPQLNQTRLDAYLDGTLN